VLCEIIVLSVSKDVCDVTLQTAADYLVSWALLFSSGQTAVRRLALRPPIGPNALPLINQLVTEISWWFLQTSRE